MIEYIMTKVQNALSQRNKVNIFGIEFLLSYKASEIFTTKGNDIVEFKEFLRLNKVEFDDLPNKIILKKGRKRLNIEYIGV
ncbi:MAG: hypothetical protein ACRCX2_33450 [Paraclostridium sp.]